MRRRWFAALMAAAITGGGWAGISLAAGTAPVAPITGNQMFYQPGMGYVPSPLTLLVPIRNPDTIEAVSIGRDDLSPFATVEVSFSPMSLWGQQQPNLYIFTYRPLWDAFNGTTVPFGPPPPVTGPVGVQGDLDDHFTAVDVFARHMQTVRANWNNPPMIPPYQLLIAVDPAGIGQGFGNPPAGALPWAYNEFWQYEIVY